MVGTRFDETVVTRLAFRAGWKRVGRPRPATGTMVAMSLLTANGAAPLFTRRFYVSMADVDAAMILFYATPLLWAERLLSDWRREAGHSVSRMLVEGLGSPVVRTEITYLRPMRLDDEVEATLWFKARSARSFTVVCQFAAGVGGPVGAEVLITQVTIELDEYGEMRPAAVPADFVAALEAGGVGA